MEEKEMLAQQALDVEQDDDSDFSDCVGQQATTAIKKVAIKGMPNLLFHRFIHLQCYPKISRQDC